VQCRQTSSVRSERFRKNTLAHRRELQSQWQPSMSVVSPLSARRCGHGSLLHLIQRGRWFYSLRKHQAVSASVVVKDLGIATPVDRGLHLLDGFVLAELLVQEIVEEFFMNRMVRFALEHSRDLPEKQ